MGIIGESLLAILGIGTSWKQVTAYRLVMVALGLTAWGVFA